MVLSMSGETMLFMMNYGAVSDAKMNGENGAHDMPRFRHDR